MSDPLAAELATVLCRLEDEQDVLPFMQAMRPASDTKTGAAAR